MPAIPKPVYNDPGVGRGPSTPAPTTPMQKGQVGWEFDTGGRGWIPQWSPEVMNYWGDMRMGSGGLANPWIGQVDQNNFLDSIGQFSGQTYDQYRGSR